MNRKRFADRASLASYQLVALRELITALVPNNPFYSDRLRAAGLDCNLATVDDFTARMPFTTKQQIIDNQLAHPPYGSNLTRPVECYTRYCQTSGTTGEPMRWLDTPKGWQWMLDNWHEVLSAAGARAGDRGFFAFSFGPFLGFWTAFEAAAQLGLMCIPGGGMTSATRLTTIIDNEVKFLFCTPTYAIRLAEVGTEQKIDLSRSKVKRIVVAGEPGGSVPATRSHIERQWPGATVFDHHGMTEVGPVSFENPRRPGILHVIEPAYLAEIIDVQTDKPVEDGQPGELVLTTLGRPDSPLLRYRTGDLVRRCVDDPQVVGRPEIALDGGILGRTDDMISVRGVNLYPSGVDQIVRADREVAEYRVEVHNFGSKIEIMVVVEPSSACSVASAMANRLAAALRNAFGLRIDVTIADSGLPRFEMKAQRWIRVSSDEARP